MLQRYIEELEDSLETAACVRPATAKSAPRMRFSSSQHPRKDFMGGCGPAVAATGAETQEILARSEVELARASSPVRQPTQLERSVYCFSVIAASAAITTVPSLTKACRWYAGTHFADRICPRYLL